MYPLVLLYQFGINTSEKDKADFLFKVQHQHHKKMVETIGEKESGFILLSLKTSQELFDELKVYFESRILGFLFIAELDTSKCLYQGDPSTTGQIEYILKR